MIQMTFTSNDSRRCVFTFYLNNFLATIALVPSETFTFTTLHCEKTELKKAFNFFQNHNDSMKIMIVQLKRRYNQEDSDVQNFLDISVSDVLCEI